jgi:hypothetical protein
MHSNDANHNNVLMVGNFNELIGALPAGIVSVMVTDGNSNTLGHCHGIKQEKPRTYAR